MFAGKRMLDEKLISLEKFFLAMSDKTRLRLLGLMAAGEVSVGYLSEQTGESQPKVSRHLAYLRNCGLVSTRRDGKWIYYGINESENKMILRILKVTLGVLSLDSGSIENYDGFDDDRMKEPVEQSEGHDDALPIYLL